MSSESEGRGEIQQGREAAAASPAPGEPRLPPAEGRQAPRWQAPARSSRRPGDGMPGRVSSPELQLSPSLAREIVEGLCQPLVVLDPAPRIRFANRAFRRAFGAEDAADSGRTLFELGEQWRSEPLRRLLDADLADRASPARLELQLEVEGIGPRLMTLRVDPLPETGPAALLLTMTDETERVLAVRATAEEAGRARRRSEQRLRTSVSEIHHRVKNNIASIGALVRLEASSQRDSTAKEAFERLAARLKSFTALYELLAAGDEKGRIELTDYLRRLCDGLGQMGDGVLHDGTIELVGEPFDVSVETAVALGVAVNELVTNALKYAFPDGRRGSIRVLLERDGKEIRLIVLDDGIGLGAEREEPPCGLGLRLVLAYVEQLGGSLSSGDAPRGGTQQVIALPANLAL